MSQPQQETKSVIIGVSRTNEQIDAKGRRRFDFTFSPTEERGDQVQALINALVALKGKKVKLDFRIEERTASNGSTFPTSFVMVREVQPKTAGTYKAVPKSNAAERAAKVRGSL